MVEHTFDAELHAFVELAPDLPSTPFVMPAAAAIIHNARAVRVRLETLYFALLENALRGPRMDVTHRCPPWEQSQQLQRIGGAEQQLGIVPVSGTQPFHDVVSHGGPPFCSAPGRARV
jgi:hypothetical protein